MAVIYDVPAEIIFAITRLLGIEDAFMLGLSCRYFAAVLGDNSICRQLLVTNAPYSPECLDAKQSGHYAQALRRLAKRRQALSAPEPFTAAVVAVGDSHMYVNGTLLYIVESTLRVLPLRGTVNSEIVVDIRALLDSSVPESQNTVKYKFTLLYYADGLVACRYSHFRRVNETWLVVFHIREGWATSCQLGTAYKLFVRSNHEYLYFGTHTGQGADGYRRWILQGFSLLRKKFINRNIYLDDVIGSDIGNNVYFAVLDGYFYALSNQTSYEVINDDKSSYYYCCRFPMGQPDDMEVATKSSLWRRKNAEGPIDDRFTFLKLEKSEVNNALVVIESRKEWRLGSHSGKRTYYMQEIVFETCQEGRAPVVPAIPATPAAATAASSGNSALDYGMSTAVSTNVSGDTSNHNHNPHQLQQQLQVQQPQTVGTTQGQMHKSLGLGSVLGTPSLVRRHGGHPHRPPQNVHPGDDGSKMILFTLSSTPIQTYHVPCSTFLDLVHNPTTAEPETQRLMLRAGCRKPRHPMPSISSGCPTCCQPLPYDHHIHRCQPTSAAAPETTAAAAFQESAGSTAMFGGMSEAEYDDPLYPQGEIDRLFYDKDVMTWPPTKQGDQGRHSGSSSSSKKGKASVAMEAAGVAPAQHTGGAADGEEEEDDDPRYAELNGVLNPPNHHGHVMGTWDGRTMVYSSGGSGGGAEGSRMQAIVFLSFDPSICLPGLKSWHEQTAAAPGEGGGGGGGGGEATSANGGENRANEQELKQPQQQRSLALSHTYDHNHNGVHALRQGRLLGVTEGRGGAWAATTGTSIGEGRLRPQASRGGRPPGEARLMAVDRSGPLSWPADKTQRQSEDQRETRGKLHEELQQQPGSGADMSGVAGRRGTPGDKDTTRNTIAPWAHCAKPMYHSISSGFEFSFPRLAVG